MNKIVISKRQSDNQDPSILNLAYQNANKMLPILRSEHFKAIVLEDVGQVEAKSLRFLIQLSRLLKSDGSVSVKGGKNKELNALLSKLNFHEGDQNESEKAFLKSKPQPKVVDSKQKLAIGFKSNQAEEQIDENQLLKGQNIDLNKKKVESCSTKVRACANCSCGRKQAEQSMSKEELVKTINEGKPVTGCGKCFMGDGFRCGSCPYKGLPAFKPGDKLKLMEEGGVAVEEATTVVSATGKVKLQL